MTYSLSITENDTGLVGRQKDRPKAEGLLGKGKPTSHSSGEVIWHDRSAPDSTHRRSTEIAAIGACRGVPQIKWVEEGGGEMRRGDGSWGKAPGSVGPVSYKKVCEKENKKETNFHCHCKGVGGGRKITHNHNTCHAVQTGVAPFPHYQRNRPNSWKVGGEEREEARRKVMIF